MAYYIKLFQNHSDYLAFTQTGDFIRPNVSACVEQEEVHYNPTIPCITCFVTLPSDKMVYLFNGVNPQTAPSMVEVDGVRVNSFETVSENNCLLYGVNLTQGTTQSNIISKTKHS